jgi:hypothetical protein
MSLSMTRMMMTSTLYWSRRKKFKIARDAVTELRELLCHFGTQQFVEYIYELEVIKRKVRRGEPMIGSKRRKGAAVKDAVDDSCPVEGGDEGGSTVEVEDLGEASVVEEEVTSVKREEKLVFLKYINKKGRPKHSGAGKLMFPKPKSSSKSVNKKTKNTGNISPKNVSVEVSDTEVPVEDTELHGGELQICMLPCLSFQIGDNVITRHEYSSLAPRHFLIDTVVNWWLRLLDVQHVQKCQGHPTVLLLNTCFYERLKNWDPATGLPKEELGLQKWTEFAQLWRCGSRLVVLPVCWNSHYYTLVAVLDPAQPLLIILESIGGMYARVPPYANQFCSFLLLLRAGVGEGGPGFQTRILVVPRQSPGSNDCGLFCMTFAEKILEDPDSFEDLAKKGVLDVWFPASSVLTKRDEVARLIGQQAVEQREPGREMAGHPLHLPLPKPLVVYNEVN